MVSESFVVRICSVFVCRRLLTEICARHVPADFAEFNSIRGADLLKVEKKPLQNSNIENN